MVAGLGGQGALLATQILVRAGLGDFPHITWFPSYATFVRGGDCEGTAILSDEPIHSPLVFSPKSLIIMSPTALEAFSNRIAPGSLLILDSSLVANWSDREGVTAVKVPASEQAANLGSPQSSNLLLLGVYLKTAGALELDAVEKVLIERLGEEGKEAILAKNLEALKWGYDYAS
jgi:2-oxoglutarate ferredoxin oxidoreductase subunit gamma